MTQYPDLSFTRNCDIVAGITEHVSGSYRIKPKGTGYDLYFAGRFESSHTTLEAAKKRANKCNAMINATAYRLALRP